MIVQIFSAVLLSRDLQLRLPVVFIHRLFILICVSVRDNSLTSYSV